VIDFKVYEEFSKLHKNLRGQSKVSLITYLIKHVKFFNTNPLILY
jgi:hypothetical protein